MSKKSYRAAALVAGVSVALLPVGVAYASVAVPAHQAATSLGANVTTAKHGTDVGGGMEAVIEGGRLVVHQIGDHSVVATLKPGQVYDKGIYVKFSADGKTFTTQTQGGKSGKPTQHSVSPKTGAGKSDKVTTAKHGTDIGGGMEAVIEGGRLVIHQIGDHSVVATLKPGQVYDKGIYVKFSADGKTFTTQTQGGKSGKPTQHPVPPKADAGKGAKKESAKQNKPRGAVDAGEAPESEHGAFLPIGGAAGAIGLLGAGTVLVARRKAAGNR